ncbi:NirD/YgiW/YdeI family stress tolerance protein [Acinetobacter baumannii]|uniref:NirD/YgiW/YdeI family stress tolerance protein n=1 Tax=Acinetobacter baumannii TaxID=470 RepID=UPI0002CEFA80|nr:NirD/YgiW/YdeI family stress tolerance protein [Acinetobacter baumannii]ENW51300.1 TIGR00156 family protein [Acinetobacter baumannii NIPH 67]MDC4322775.1 NirD/YgiW/YdeI family stress tolerance protein [Acinetobacter baumannii]MDC4833540.1 NirD/YgiW/YdeI family stress tolerance protein [Acinetobacter baumannii]MDK2185474.1 NirD/YgiW/YdeI family stress tolerance protein [Acinetobacter baumannii]MDK2258283.1 NirD/YgiW/YdeI family stress tolerance protein [Acinetobacter baumannii]
MKMLKVILMTAGMATAGVVVANTPVNQVAIAPATVTTVKQALASKDNTPVKLHGQVVKSLGDEKYQFRDKSGSITIDVDDELWQGRPVSANTNVTLIGEVDIDYKPLKRVEIDVDQVQF